MTELLAVAVENIPAGSVVEVAVGARSTVYRYRPGDPIAFATAAADHARQVRAGWDQADRYQGSAVPEDAGELLDLAWGIIANVGVHGDGWEGQHPSWVQAAIRWRNAYLDTLARTVLPGVAEPVGAVEPPPAPWVSTGEADGRVVVNDGEAVVTAMTQAEWSAAVTRSLERLGVTYEQLAGMAAGEDFSSLSARKLWMAIGVVGR